MKEIYRFTVNKKEKVQETEIIVNDKKEEITQTKTVEKEVPHVFVIKRPSRTQSEEAEIFRASTESELIRRGVISLSLLQKRLLNDGGILTEAEKKEYTALTEEFSDKQVKYANIEKLEEKTEEQKEEAKVLLDRLTDIIKRINQLDGESNSLYNRTAEVLSRNKTILWLTLMLSYEEKDGKMIPVFGEGDYEKKLKALDAMDEKEDEFEYTVFQKLQLISGAWYLGKANDKEGYDAFIKLFDNKGLLGLT